MKRQYIINEHRDKPFKKGTLHCPECGDKLSFKQVGFMRIIEKIDGIYYYDAQCTTKKCWWNNRVIKVVANNQND